MRFLNECESEMPSEPPPWLQKSKVNKNYLHTFGTLLLWLYLDAARRNKVRCERTPAGSPGPDQPAQTRRSHVQPSISDDFLTSMFFFFATSCKFPVG